MLTWRVTWKIAYLREFYSIDTQINLFYSFCREGEGEYCQIVFFPLQYQNKPIFFFFFFFTKEKKMDKVEKFEWIFSSPVHEYDYKLFQLCFCSTVCFF